jgi:hypothetical protein
MTIFLNIIRHFAIRKHICTWAREKHKSAPLYKVTQICFFFFLSFFLFACLFVCFVFFMSVSSFTTLFMLLSWIISFFSCLFVYLLSMRLHVSEIASFLLCSNFYFCFIILFALSLLCPLIHCLSCLFTVLSLYWSLSWVFFSISVFDLSPFLFWVFFSLSVLI